MTKRDTLLWTPILGAPFIWFLTLLTNFALAPLPCGKAEMIRRVVSAIALVLTASMGALAVSLWRRNRVSELPAAGAPAERVRAMSVAGVALSASFLLVLVAQAMPDFLISGCQS